MAHRKFYVVWNGHHTGIFDSWEECKLQINNYPNAQYKSFDNQEDAIRAYRGHPDEYLKVFRAMAEAHTPVINHAANPEITRNAIAVDAACSGNPGPVEYRGVDIDSGIELFHVGPLQGGTNNMGEFLALVHAMAMLDKQGRPDVTIYSDSRTAQAWVRNRKAKTTITPNPHNATIMNLIARAEAWLLTHQSTNPIKKWETERWGEIPADFGRK